MTAQPAPPLPIAALIDRRCAELGLDPSGLVRACGYSNVTKGLRRLDALRDGRLRRTDGLVGGLPAGLGVEPPVVEAALEATRAELRKRDEAAYRARFVPHAVVLTDRSVPRPIFVAAFIGVERILRIDFDLARDRASYPAQALAALKDRMGGPGGRGVPAFGTVTGFVVNYAPDRAVRFGLDGRAVELLPKAARVGRAAMLVGGRPIPQGLIA